MWAMSVITTAISALVWSAVAVRYLRRRFRGFDAHIASYELPPGSLIVGKPEAYSTIVKCLCSAVRCDCAA